MAMKDAPIIQYAPFMSFVHPSFWHALTELKLNVDMLDESSREIHGRFTYRDDIGAIFDVDGTSFNKVPQTELYCSNIKGTLMNKNTTEDFKKIDKTALLNSVGEVVGGNIYHRAWIRNPSCLLSFFILSYANPKKYHYYYWFAFPAPSQPTVYVKHPMANITRHFTHKQLETLKSYKALDNAQKSFFIVAKKDDGLVIHTLAEVIGHGITETAVKINMYSIYFVFYDPSNTKNPGWPLRLLVAALLEYCPTLGKHDIQVIALRCSVHGGIENSCVLTIKVPQDLKKISSAGWVGWERNVKGKFGPRIANMSSSMDPSYLADKSSDLNIKLMKWRLVPGLNLNVLKTTKCLLLGAGTLGCHVARGLLAWGFRYITFIDNGKVSYSNPTRQVLYTHEDCINGGKRKAEIAAANLKKILPSVKSIGVSAHIPMPGHPVGEALRKETIENIKLITEAITEHDVVFLLLDTREARWLPTLLAAHHGKIVINAALGFDSFLVMRHGVSATIPADSLLRRTFIAGSQLGCYFCNDVTAPGNSMKDRTLDQQCTVTRPGVAAIAGALAVEILVGLLQHPLRVHAPAVYNLTSDWELPQTMQGELGPIPHSIRGFLHSYTTVVPTYSKFRQCIACSELVLAMYRKENINFLLRVLDRGNYLEEVTGLNELQMTAEMTDIVELSDDED